MEEINIKTLLPVGEKLKPLLSKSCISEADLKGILAERGVFIGDNSKQMSIPLLTLSIISPKEFEKLQEFQKTKAKIADMQGKLRELEKQKTELENTDFVAVARSYHLTPGELAEFLKTRQMAPASEPQKQEEVNED